MKNFRKVLIAVFSVMLLVCMGLFTVACDNGTESGNESGNESDNGDPAQKVYYTVTVAEYDTAKGSVTLDPAPADGKYEKDASVSVTVTPNANYAVDAVKANGTVLTANSSGKYVFTVTADTTVAVTFKAETVTPPPSGETDEKVSVTLTCGENGSATLDPAPADGKVAKGTSVKLTVSPAENYEVDSVKVNNAAVELTGNEYTFTANANTTVEVTFKVKQVSLTATYEASQGSVTCDPLPEDGKLTKGTAVTVTIEPAYGYEIVSVTVNDENVTSELEELLLLPDRPDLNMRDHSPKRSLDLGAVNEDTEIAVTFQQATHKITFNLTGPGTCKLYDSTVSLEEQTELKNLTAVSSATKVHASIDCESYVTAEVHVNDGARDLKMSVVSGNTYFWVVDKDLTVTVTFTVDREKAPRNHITVTGGENGAYELTPKGGFPLEDGVFYGVGEATITLTPDTATDIYIIDALKIKSNETDSVETDVTADLENGSYTFPVTGDVELTVSFKKFEEVTPDSTYNGSWQCAVKGETTSTTNIAVVTRTKKITITGTDITTISGTSYTATFGYTVYLEGDIEEYYTIYLVPGLSDAILALSIGTSTTYFIKTSPKPTLPEVTIDEVFMGADGSEGSSWYGGAASMPIIFEFGGLKIDNVAATFLAGSETDGGIVYTVYANGALYELIYTTEDDFLVLHPYGKSTENDVSYERETPPDPVPVPQYAGKYSNNEHTVEIDADGNFSFDGTARKLYYDEQTRIYTFKTNVREYTVKFTASGVEIFNAAANEDWTLRKIEEGTAQYTLTVNCPNGTVAYSAKNAEMKYWAGSSVTLTITANKHYEVEKVTVNGEDKEFSNNAGTVKITVTIEADTTVEITFKELKEENLLSDLYIGVYTSGSTTVTITESGVTIKDTSWGVNVTFTDAQITHTGEGQFTLQNGNKKFTFTFTDTGVKVGDPNWAMGGATKTLTKQSS